MRGIKKFTDEASFEDGGLDIGLILLAAASPRGVERTHAEIAFVCGVNRQAIWHIERRAKQKLKAEFARRGIDIDF